MHWSGRRAFVCGVAPVEGGASAAELVSLAGAQKLSVWQAS
jgi:hypothetical protein